MAADRRCSTLFDTVRHCSTLMATDGQCLCRMQVDLQPCYDTPYETHVFDAIALTGARIKGEDMATGTVQLKALWMPLEDQIRGGLRGGLDLGLGEDVEGHADDDAFHQVTREANWGALRVALRRATGLKAADSNGFSDPYVYLSIPLIASLDCLA